MAKLATAVFASILILSGWHGSFLYSSLSLILLVLLSATAVPLCKSMFGSGPLALVMSYPVGYLVHAFLLSLCAWAFGFSPVVLIAYLVVSILVAVFFWRSKCETSAIEWTADDTRHLFIWLFLTLAAVALPFLHVGYETEQGFAYRAYFNGDMFRNIATAGTLMRSGIPPENPYFAGYTLHYYWFFHTIPAFLMKMLPNYRPELILVQLSLITALAFVAVLFVTIRSLTKSRKTLLFCLFLFLLGGSYEGIYILKHLHEKHLPWIEFTNLNVDGILRWLLKLPQVDTLYRPLLYAPQHLLTISAILIVLLLRTNRSALPRILSLLLLFISVGFSVIVSAIGILGLCILFLIHIARGRWRENRAEILTGIATGPLFLLLLIKGLKMFDPYHGATIIGADPNLIAHLPVFFLLQWGPLLFFGIMGLFFARHLLLTIYLFLSVLFLLFFRVNVLGLTEIGLKTGYLIDLTLLLFAALFVDYIFTMRERYSKWLIFSGVVLLVPASVTWIMDAYNSQDFGNRRFTTYISKEKMDMYQWIKNNIDPRGVIQDYRIRKPDFLQSYISEIPAFANRPMYLGDVILSEIFQIPADELERRRKIAAELVNLEDPRLITHLAQQEGIRFFLVWKKEGRAFQQDQARRYFKRINESEELALFEVTGEKPRLYHASGDILMEEYDSGEVLLTSSYGNNFYEVEQVPGQGSGRWMSQNAELSLNSLRDLKGDLFFMAQAFGRKRTMVVSMDGQPILKQTIGTGATKISVPLSIHEGSTRLWIQSAEEPERAPDNRLLSLRIWRMQFVPSLASQ